MSHLQIVDQGEIFRNPLPGHRVINSFFPAGVVLDNGEILVVARVAAAMYSVQGALELFRSTDGGRTWQRQGPPRPLGIPGQSSGAVELKDGRILLIYSHRDDTDQPGIKVVMSDDAGDCFDAREPLVVWDAYGKEALGVPRTDKYPGKHDAIAYGAPRILRLREREALAIFWCTQSADTHCRWTRVQVTNQ